MDKKAKIRDLKKLTGQDIEEEKKGSEENKPKYDIKNLSNLDSDQEMEDQTENNEKPSPGGEKSSLSSE